MFVTLQVPAAEVQAGDFTTFTGFRRVCSVQAVNVTSGRGRKRRTVITAYEFCRFDGTVDSVYPDAIVTVRRPMSDGPS